jgi:NitT/TauT family transport system ATP-binding protein
MTVAQSRIVVRDLVKRFPDGQGGERTILDGVSFDVPDGGFVSLMGPSGCGKSTTLNVIAGLTFPTSGQVLVSGEPVEAGCPQTTRVGYVFQQPRLLNWRTVGQNVEFALEAAGVRRAEWRVRTEASLRLVGLEDRLDSYPLRLSGGQQQRVSIARALVTEPDVVLMDEPFSHLDEITATRLRRQLTEIWERTRKTILFVTHDISEAVLLSEKVVVFDPRGRIVETFPIDVPLPRSAHEDAMFEVERRIRHDTSVWWADAEAAAPPARQAAGR